MLGTWIKKYSGLAPEDIAALQDNRYIRIMRRLFERHMAQNPEGFQWARSEFDDIASELQIKVPSNLGDIIYSIRHAREELPTEILELAPEGQTWLLLPDGRGKYRFVLARFSTIEPRYRAAIKIPDATPQLVSRYALGDEQAVLARVRYSRLIDTFLSVTAAPLQSHLRATVEAFSRSQIETDELYVGVDLSGAQYIVPVQAKGSDESVGAVQAIQDIYCCREKFPDLICRAVAAKTVSVERTADGIDLYTIAMMELAIEGNYDVWVRREERYTLVPSSHISAEELAAYREEAVARMSRVASEPRS